MAGPGVVVRVLVLVVGVHLASTDAESALMRTAGCSPACLASSLTLYSQIQEQNQYTTFVEEMREIMREMKTGRVRSCPGHIIEEGKQSWRWRPRNCHDLLYEGDSGHGVRQVYPIPTRPEEAVDVYCDHTVDGGGWTTILRRTNSTTRETFLRTWKDYVEGFGNLAAEFWMGLQLQHLITSTTMQELRVDMEDFEGNKRWAKYNVYRVGPTHVHYKLTVSGYTGNAGDSLAYNNGAMFSTYNADHDTKSNNCALNSKGAWWYKSCSHANLNGYQYEGSSSPSQQGIFWNQWKGYGYSLMNVTMLMRPIVVV